jgi:energy-coupling factor transporter ATP-binding protein EcfA2
VLSPISGESLPLEEEVQALVAARKRGALRITGPAGSGKTTALEHLAYVLAEANLQFLDCPASEPLPALVPDRWIFLVFPELIDPTSIRYALRSESALGTTSESSPKEVKKAKEDGGGPPRIGRPPRGRLALPPGTIFASASLGGLTWGA